MRAVRVITVGEPEVLTASEIPTPQPGPGEVLVRVAASGVNFIDTYHRSGLYPADLPFTPGVEGAGVVEATGGDVDFEPGNRVAWASGLGSYSEYQVVPAERAVTVPDGIDLEIAAASLLQGLTAHYLVADTYPVADGDLCLVHAGAGGVGLLLIQMAKRRGATVLTTVSTSEKGDLARAAGADHVINYAETDFGDAVEAVVGANALHVVYDGVGAATADRGLQLLRPRGMLVIFGNASGPPAPVDPLDLMRFGSLFLTRPSLGHYTADRSELELRSGELFEEIAGGRLDVRIGGRFSLADAAEAHRALQGRRTTGKVLLLP